MQFNKSEKTTMLIALSNYMATLGLMSSCFLDKDSIERFGLLAGQAKDLIDRIGEENESSESKETV